MPGCVQCGSLLTLHDTNRIGYYQEKIWHNLTSTKYVILTVQVHGGDMSKQISFIHCSCCKICDQGDSWLLKELLKKNDLFSPFFKPISISEELCAKTAVHGLVVCDSRHLLAAPQQLVIPCASAWVRGWTFFWKGRWPWEDQGFCMAFNCYIDMHCCKSTNTRRQY